MQPMSTLQPSINNKKKKSTVYWEHKNTRTYSLNLVPSKATAIYFTLSLTLPASHLICDYFADQSTHLIIDFQAGEGGVFKADINADHVIYQCVGLVSL